MIGGRRVGPLEVVLPRVRALFTSKLGTLDNAQPRKVWVLFITMIKIYFPFFTLKTVSKVPLTPQLNGGLSGASTGWVMLFSAGTFLYVSTVHVLPEITQQVSGA